MKAASVRLVDFDGVEFRQIFMGSMADESDRELVAETLLQMPEDFWPISARITRETEMDTAGLLCEKRVRELIAECRA